MTKNKNGEKINQVYASMKYMYQTSFPRINKTLTEVCDCFRSPTSIIYNFSDEQRITKDLKPQLFDIMPWLFDFDEPWKAPNHYPQAPRKIIAKSSAVKKHLTVYKQPRARMGFLRGNRN